MRYSTKIMKRIFDRRTENTSDVWLTPPHILRALGDFDLDPCAASNRLWNIAKHHYTAEDDGLSRPWIGRVYLNPPYGKELPVWLERLAQHGNGIALTAARTETRWFHDLVWHAADGILFFKGRLKFYTERGRPGGTATFPSCLIAYGEPNAVVLQSVANVKLNGYYISLDDKALTKSA